MHPDAKIKLALAGGNKDRAEAEKNKIKSDLEKAFRLDAKLQKAADTLEFAKRALLETRAILENWKGEVREQVSSALSTEFAPMLPKDKFIDEVWIDENFVVHVRNTTGNDIVDELSSGERQSLAFAFSFGLNSVSGYSLPMIIILRLGEWVMK